MTRDAPQMPPADPRHATQMLLQATACDGTGPWVDSTYGASAAALSAIATQIACCVLPQDITVCVANGTQITLSAAQRRLLRMRIASPAGPLGSDKDMPEDTDLDPSAATAVRDTLLALCTDGYEMTVTVGPAVASSRVTSGGIPASALGLAPPAAPNAYDARVATFLAHEALTIGCAIWHDAEVSDPIQGDSESADALRVWADPFLQRLLDERFPLAATFETEGAIVIGDGAGDHVLLGSALGRIAVVLLRDTAPERILTAWRLCVQAPVQPERRGVTARFTGPRAPEDPPSHPQASLES